MKKNYKILLVMCLLTMTGCVSLHDTGEREGQITVNVSPPIDTIQVKSTYPDFDLENLSVVKKGETDDSSRTESNGEYTEDIGRDEKPECTDESVDGECGGSEPVVDSDGGYPMEDEGTGTETGYPEPMSELVESESDLGSGPIGDEGDYIEAVSEPSESVWSEGSGLTYLGEWTTTAYCPCEICCGAYASGYTASGTLATAGRTVACGSLPFGTQIMIDGNVYTVEDTGVYGEWVDIFFDSHDQALAYGMQVKEVYLVE